MNPNDMIEEHFLTIEYASTRREIFRSFLRGVAQSPKYRRTILLYSVAMGVMTLLIRRTISRSFTLRDAMGAVAGAAGFLVFIPIWVFIRGKTAKRTLTISRDGISTEIGRLKGQVPWDNARVVTDTPRFVLTARTNGNAFFIPDRAFSGSDTEITSLMKFEAGCTRTRNRQSRAEDIQSRHTSKCLIKVASSTGQCNTI
jgi:hypothetical protein